MKTKNEMTKCLEGGVSCPQASKSVGITIFNRLVKERRDINVYHHRGKSGHIISCNTSLLFSINPFESDDFLHISVQRGPGSLVHFCMLDLPSFIDFRFSNSGESILIHSGERLLLCIPPGFPLWEIKMRIPSRLPDMPLLSDCSVVIGDSSDGIVEGFTDI